MAARPNYLVYKAPRRCDSASEPTYLRLVVVTRCTRSDERATKGPPETVSRTGLEVLLGRGCFAGESDSPGRSPYAEAADCCPIGCGQPSVGTAGS